MSDYDEASESHHNEDSKKGAEVPSKPEIPPQIVEKNAHDANPPLPDSGKRKREIDLYSESSDEVRIPEERNILKWSDIRFGNQSIEMYETEVFFRDDGYVSSDSSSSDSY